MTKRYGSLVGTVLNQVPAQPVDMAYAQSTDRVIVRDTITLAAAPIADTVSLCKVGWETVFNPKGDIWFGALGAGVTIAVGDVTYPAALCAATAANAAGSLFFQASVPIANYFQPLWQQLGYASLAAALLVGPKCELLLTIAGGAATGVVTWQFSGSLRI